MANYNKSQPESIQAMFGSIATRYDKTNAILSFCLHKRWNAQLVKSVIRNNNPAKLADLCCGTGEIAFAFLKRAKQSSTVYLVDFCPEMLACAQQKALQLPLMEHNLSYIQADVQKLPLPKESVHCATMAYGIRNVKEPAVCLQEVYRILKPGANFSVLELTQPENRFLKIGHSIYLRTLLPLLGKLVTTNKDAYKYLCSSIQNFIKPKELAALFTETGFEDVQIQPLHGGIATIISGRKPLT